MYLTLALEGIHHDTRKSLHRQSVLHSHLCSQVANGVNRTVPHNVNHVNVVAHKRLAVVVDVDHAYESFAVLTEIIYERRILSVRIIGICWIVHRRLVVAE